MRYGLLLCLLTQVLVHAPALAGGPVEARFSTQDGVQIVGSYHPPPGKTPAPVVILLHMYRSDRSAWKPLIEALSDRGMAVLAIDMRGHGQSVQPAPMALARRAAERDQALFRNMYRDVLAAYAWLAEQPTTDLTRLGIVGASVGCSVAIDYAARDRSVDVVVCMTPGENYLGLDSREHIAAFGKHGQRPILLLATEGERKATDVLGGVYEGATTRVVGSGRVHGTHMFGKIDGIDKKIVEFLTRHLRGGGETPVAAAVDGDEYFQVGSLMDASLGRYKRRVFSSAKEAEARGLTPASGIEALRTADRPDSDVLPSRIDPPSPNNPKRRPNND